MSFLPSMALFPSATAITAAIVAVQGVSPSTINFLLSTLSSAFWSYQGSSADDIVETLKQTIKEMVPQTKIEVAHQIALDCSKIPLTQKSNTITYLIKQLNTQSESIRDAMSSIERAIYDYQRPWYKRRYYGVSLWGPKLNVDREIKTIKIAVQLFVEAFALLTQFFDKFTAVCNMDQQHSFQCTQDRKLLQKKLQQPNTTDKNPNDNTTDNITYNNTNNMDKQPIMEGGVIEGIVTEEVVKEGIVTNEMVKQQQRQQSRTETKEIQKIQTVRENIMHQ